MESKVKKSIRFFAPYKIVKIEKSYILWLTIIFFGLINVWGGLITGKFDIISSAFNEGQMYTFSIALCAPFIVTFYSESIISKGYGQQVHFVKYKNNCSLIDIIWIIILSFCWVGSLINSILFQILFGIISVLFSFYMFCLSEMEKHYEQFKEYDDYEYLKNEKNNMKNTSEKATTTNNDGEEVDL